MLSLKDDEEVVGINKIKPATRYIFYITSSGRVKVTESKYFPTMNRKDSPVSLLPLNATDRLIAVAGVNKTSKVKVYQKIGDPTELKISDIKLSMRVAKAEKLVKVRKGDTVIGIEIK